MTTPVLAAGTGSSIVVTRCQVCDHPTLDPILFLGYLPPVNQMRPLGEVPHEQAAYPALWLHCPQCKLVQLGLTVDKEVLFPPSYPYTSGTTKILRENFAEMYRENQTLFPIAHEDLIVDIGSNDGTLLSNWKEGGHRVLGIEPTDMGQLANERGIQTMIRFFDTDAAKAAVDTHGHAKRLTATNVFAHIEHVHDIVEGILALLDEDGIFISESHYLMSLLETLQYDTIYHEHLRYYSLHSLQYLLAMHGLEVIHARRIPTHGGSIRVYAARKGQHEPRPSVAQMLADEEAQGVDLPSMHAFRDRVVASKLALYRVLDGIKREGGRIYGLGAPSRASTLIQYTGLDDGILDCVLEIDGSYKIGKYMPGTLIPVEEESRLFTDPPEYLLLLSWHIADELMPKLRAKGYRGRFLIPLPEPRVVED